MRKLYQAAVLSLAMLSAILHAQDGGQNNNSSELSLHAAKYQFELKNYPAARTLLLREQSKGHLHWLLLARVLVEEKSYRQAQEAFQRVQLDEVPDSIRNNALLALADLYYSQSMCTEALDSLQQTKKLPVGQDAFARFMQSSCMLQLEKSEKQLERAEKVLEAGIRGGMKPDTYLWFAYAYYNLAVAAANIASFERADRLFEQALHYTGQGSEGLAMAEKIRLARAKVRYLDNRFDFAMETYEELPIDAYWQDEALLGYGWAAFKNYQSDRALEAWWQLTNLSYKSINVYQAYLLIPFAYERANAFSQALSGYDRAVEQYGDILAELEQFSQHLNTESIHQHAVHYYLNPQGLEPIHPLLAVTYTQPDFRLAVEQIGQLTSYQERLTQYQYFLELQKSYRAQFEAEADQRKAWRQKQVNAVKQQFETLDVSLDLWLDKLLAQELSKEGVPNALAELNQRYQLLKRKSHGDLHQRIQRLQGVLLLRLVESSKEADLLEKLHQLSQWQQTLRVRFTEYLELEQQSFEQQVDDADIEQMQQQVAGQLQQVELVLAQVLQQLLQKTELALQEQQNTIANYERQARVARANLREEFYQRGGSKLWY